MNEWDFEEVARRRRATEDNLTAQENGGGMATLCILVGVLLHTQKLNKKQHMVGITNFMIPCPKLN